MKNQSNSRRSFLGKGLLGGSALGFSSTFAFGNIYESTIEETPKNSIPSDLKITEIKCGYIRNGHSLFVKIYTNQDIWGCGEGVDAVPGTYHLVQMMGKRIQGKNPLNVHRLFEDIRRSGFFEGAQSGMYVAVLQPWKLLCGIWPGRRSIYQFTNCWGVNSGIKFVFTWIQHFTRAGFLNPRNLLMPPWKLLTWDLLP